MQAQVPHIPAHYYARITELLLASQPELKTWLEAAQIDLDFLFKPNQLLSLQQVENLVLMAIHVSHRPDLAIDLGQSLRITSHAIIGYGVLTSETLDQAMHFLSRYFRLLMPLFRMNILQDHEHVQLVFEPTAALSPLCLQFHFESICSAVHTALKELLHERLVSYHVYFSFAEPDYIERYALLKPASVHFGWEQHPVLRLKFPKHLLAIQLETADAYSRQMIEQRCLEEMKGLVSRGGIGDWVAMMLKQSTDGLPTLQELADLLHISVRTLDRHLKTEGIQFRDLSLRIRMARAKELLEREHLSIGHIALELGYSDSSNFSRAFKKYSGVSPEVFRLQMQHDQLHHAQ